VAPGCPAGAVSALVPRSGPQPARHPSTIQGAGDGLSRRGWAVNDAVVKLLLFNEQVNELEASGFTQYLLAKGGTSVSLSWSASDGVVRTRLEAPSDESIKAFVLTLRILIQPGDGISIDQLGKLYPGLAVSPEIGARFIDLVAAVAEVLDAPGGLREGRENVSRRKLMETFVYGRLAHMNADKHPRYRAWAQRPELLMFLKDEFIHTLAFLLKALMAMRRLNELALAEMAARADP
jgi:hypothetical protein